MMAALWSGASARAAQATDSAATKHPVDHTEPTATTRDVLVYKDGDRVQGELVERAGDVIVFKSDRFGVLRVPAPDAVVIRAEKPHAPAPAARKETAPAVAKAEKVEPKPATEREDEERVSIWERFSPWVLTAKVKNFFGPWHGKIAVATEVVSDTAKRQDYTADGNLHRKWERDEVQLNTHYDYAETNQVTTTDTLRGAGSFRHDFNKELFAQYRPSVEWNRASTLNGRPNDYVLLQQEIGAGFTILARPSEKLRTGLSENLFDVWNSAPPTRHTSRVAESLFEEAEWTLPWRMTLTQRGVWYPVIHRSDGWENRIELSKKFTETLSVGVRHEIRRDNPDGSSPDYTRLRFLFGLDF